MPSRDYEADHAGMGLWLRGAEARALVEAAAERGVAFARSTAPKETGRYAGSIHAEAASGYDGRAAADVVADVVYADEVERRHHTMGAVAQMLDDGR